MYDAETTLSLYIAPSEVAGMFASMDSKEQARFWEALADIVAKWDKPACFQWQMMRDELDKLEPRDGLDAFKDMAQYAA